MFSFCRCILLGGFEGVAGVVESLVGGRGRALRLFRLMDPPPSSKHRL